jgi:membrane peptidoglycan carboxypeptidase
MKDCYHPSNFDNKFKGPISLRSAIAESRNVPSVKLEYLVGVQNAVDTAHSLGITTLTDPSQYGLSLVLGGGEVTLLDMTGAYGVFGNAGMRNPTTGILEVDDHNGNVLEQFQPNPNQVMDKNVALTMDNVLADAQARIPTFGTTAITIPGVAVKTGTTNDDRDAWTVGYTPSISIGVWSGNNDNSPMKNGGSAISGPTWKQMMQYALTKYPSPGFQDPVPNPNYSSLKPILRGQWMGNESVMVDKLTGLRATSATPVEDQIEKVVTDVHDILYWVNKSDPTGPVPSNPSSDAEYHLWEPAVQTWWAQNQSKYPSTSSADIPVGYDSTTAETGSTLTVSGIPTSAKLSDTLNIDVSTTSPNPLTSVDVVIDNNFIATLPSPFHFSFSPQQYGYTTGTHSITFNATNNVYAKSTIQKTVTFTQ